MKSEKLISLFSYKGRLSISFVKAPLASLNDVSKSQIVGTIG